MPTIDFEYPKGVAVKLAELRIAGQQNEVLSKVIDPAGRITQLKLGDATVYRVENLGVANEREEAAPELIVRGPTVLLAPRQGRLEGSQGDFTTWEGLGAWTASLLAQRGQLPPEAIAEVQALVADTDDVRERVRRVYAYMQSRTHYVSIQLGIGGFLPMDPADVHRLGYGDCKALSNYTRLLLSAVDVPSNYCVIGAGPAKTIRYPEFASVSQANHAILGVPLPADTMWLECTSQTSPADYAASDWTAGRYALWVDGTSGSLVRTDGYSPSQNTLATSTVLTLSATGPAAFERRSVATGTQIERFERMRNADAESRRRLARKDFALGVEGLDPNIRFYQTPVGPRATTTERATIPTLAKHVGARIALPVFGFLQPLEQLRDTLHRQSPVEVTESYVRTDSLLIKLEEGVQLIAVPEQASFSAPHASYSLSAKPVAGGLLAVRTLRMQAGVYPASDAASIAKFAALVSRADRSVVATAPEGEKRT